MSKRVIKQLSDMAIDEVSLVDRGANQHALIAIAKNYSVDDLFEKARGGSHDEVDFDEFHGDDPADVVDDDVANDGHGDTGAPAGKTISGTEKTSAEDVKVKSGKAKGKKTLDRAPSRGGEDKAAPVIEESDHGKNLKSALGSSFADHVQKSAEDEEYELAKRLGLLLDDEDFEKAFGPPQQPNFQQGGQAPQMGNPPVAQSVGAQPLGQGQPQPAPFGGQISPMGPNAANPGMPTGGPQVPGPTAQPAMPGQAPMGLANMMGQVGTPPQLNISQLPPEVVQYIQQLEKQVAQSQGQNSDSGADSTDSSDNGASASNADSSDASNKPFGKSGAFNMNEDAFYEELSKAIRDEDGRAEFSKALQARFDSYEAEISKAQEVAAAERDLRLERDFIAKAADFQVPVAPEELGPVLKRAADALSLEDFGVIVKCLDAATELSEEVFGEIGKRGTGANGDIFAAVSNEAEELRKNFELSQEQATAAVFEANPQAYDEYRRALPGFRG
jgi:hypothetical protein